MEGHAAAPDEHHFHRLGEVVVRLVEQQVAERSEEHTSELQSIMRRSYAGFCLKKKKKKKMIQTRPRQKKKHNRTMKSQKSTRVKNMKPTTENNELILHYINSITEVNR